MLYQLSYLGTAGPKGLRAPVYSQTRRALSTSLRGDWLAGAI